MIEYTPIRILFRLGNIKIYSWGFLVALSFLIAILLSYKKAKKEKLEPDNIFNIALLALIFGFLGARLLFTFENGFNNFFALWQGGLSWYGGFLLAFLAIFTYLKIKKLPLRYLEIVTLFLPLAHAIARVGCFLNWDDYGKPSNLPWAIKVANDLPRHPTQLYEVVSNLIIFGFLLFLDKKKKGKVIIPTYLISYSLVRFLIDFLRESQRYLALTLAQWISLAVILIVSMTLIVKFIKDKRENKKRKLK